jgi:hypothetical protein
MYDVPNGKVQLIRVPYYDNVTIVSTVTCLPWDGEKGGVVVINAANNVHFDADIDVNGKGFRGGVGVNTNQQGFNCSENQFYYPPNGDLAAPKGEGITSVSSQKSYGKGGLANAGGGGNSHNSGGGGGSNGAAGGLGGYQLESSAFSPCDGPLTDNRGLPGQAILYNSNDNKIFMGGGGGAGHNNNPQLFKASGGNGGGIVIIMANTITGQNKSILAEGSAAMGCNVAGASSCHEAMGGGGAGGTVLLQVNAVNGSISVNTSGGKGGDMVAPAVYTRVGPGGGGSGGVCWYSTASVPLGITHISNGGVNGVCTDTQLSNYGASPGTNGVSLGNLSVPVDNTLFISPCTVPVTILSFNVSAINLTSFKLEWRTEHEESILAYEIERATSERGPFSRILSVPAQNKYAGNVYSVTDTTVKRAVRYYYRLKIKEIDGTYKYTGVRTGLLNKQSNLFVNVFPNPSKSSVTVFIEKPDNNTAVSLFNNAGQLLESKSLKIGVNTTVEFNLKEYTSGLYYIKVTGKGEAITKTIIKAE